MKILKNIFLVSIFTLLISINISSAQSCYTFTSAMSVGSTDSTTRGEVTRLQFYFYNIGLLSVQPTGYFGVLTKNAVLQYQASKGIDTVGTVGPITRQSLSIEYIDRNVSKTLKNGQVYRILMTDEEINNYVSPSWKLDFVYTSGAHAWDMIGLDSVVDSVGKYKQFTLNMSPGQYKIRQRANGQMFEGIFTVTN